MAGAADRKGPARAPRALAIAAHPDDIEFCMAGTLLLLKAAGWEIHYLNIASGNCGTAQYRAARTRALRREEARQAAKILGARWHPPFVDDLEILYELPLLRRLAATIRTVKPRLVLTHSPQDYMEDHMNTSRLAVTAVFARGMPNFRTQPAKAACEEDVALYHAMPHGLRDGLRQRIIPGAFVNTASVHSLKREALAAHRSQKAWLDASQGMDSYLRAMDDMARIVGRMSRRFRYAEGWRQHAHLGLSTHDTDPLAQALGRDCYVNPNYQRELEKGP